MTEDTPALRSRLEQAERDEEWALVVLGVWIVLLAFIASVLVFSPWPWGALVGLVVWAWGARGVYRDFTTATERAGELRNRIENPQGSTQPNR